MRKILNGIITNTSLILLAVGISFCADVQTNGTSIGQPTVPVLDPLQGTYVFTNDASRPSVNILDDRPVRYTSSITLNGQTPDIPIDPDCSNNSNTLYAGPFQIGGPNETIRIKAIACGSGVESAIVSSGEYVFTVE